MNKIVIHKSKKIKKKKAASSSISLAKSVRSLKTKISLLKIENKQLKKFNETVDESESKYRSLFEMSDDAILVIEKGKFVDCNRAVVKMLGFKSKSELLNTHPSELSPFKQPDGRLSYEKAEEMIALALKNGSHHFEWIHTKANGEDFPVEVWLCSLKYKGRILINTIWRDLTEKKKAESLILKSITEKEILLKEIHHRVKNNMQIISSLLNLQSNQISDEHLKQLLQQSRHRIESMSQIHEMLYKTLDFSKINFSDYVVNLINTLLNSIKGTSNNIKFRIDIKNVHFNINTSIPLALLINEIITNSLKHGIPGNKKGEIFITIANKTDKITEMRIGDNGIGYKNTFTPQTSHSIGFLLIHSLAEQLNGIVKKEKSGKGTSYFLRFEQV